MILRIKDFFDRQIVTEPWDELHEDEKASIERGLKDIEEGKTISLDELKRKLSQRK